MNASAEAALTYHLDRKRKALIDVQHTLTTIEDELAIKELEEDMLKREVAELEDALGITEAVPA